MTITARFLEDGTCTVETNGQNAFQARGTAITTTALNGNITLVVPHLALNCEAPADRSPPAERSASEDNLLWLSLRTPAREWPSPGTSWQAMPETHDVEKQMRVPTGQFSGLLESPMFAKDFTSIWGAGGHIYLIAVGGRVVLERRVGDVFIGSAELVMKRQWGSN